MHTKSSLGPQVSKRLEGRILPNLGQATKVAYKALSSELSPWSITCHLHFLCIQMTGRSNVRSHTPRLRHSRERKGDLTTRSITSGFHARHSRHITPPCQYFSQLARRSKFCPLLFFSSFTPLHFSSACVQSSFL